MKYIITIIFYCLLYSIHGQSNLKELESDFASYVCKCIEDEYESNELVKINSVINKCTFSILEKNIEKIKDIENKVGADSLNAFLIKLPNLVAENILYECPTFCYQMNKEQNRQRLNSECLKQFAKYKMSDNVHLLKACDCMTLRFIDSFCSNIKEKNIEELTKEIKEQNKEGVIECMENDLQLIFNGITDIDFSEYSKLISSSEEFKNINPDEYCNCYFKTLINLSSKQEITFRWFVENSKKIDEIKEKCKKLASK